MHTTICISLDFEAKKKITIFSKFASKLAKMKIVSKNDNHPGHNSAFTVAFIASRGIKMFEHTPYSHKSGLL